MESITLWEKINYKGCFVPVCSNTTRKTPEKLFVTVPRKPKLREKWYKAVHRDFSNGMSTHAMYCCGDHFNLEEDIENWVRFKLIGGNLKMKANVFPHIFNDQLDPGSVPPSHVNHSRNGFPKRKTLNDLRAASAPELPTSIPDARGEESVLHLCGEDRCPSKLHEANIKVDSRPAGSNAAAELARNGEVSTPPRDTGRLPQLCVSREEADFEFISCGAIKQEPPNPSHSPAEIRDEHYESSCSGPTYSDASIPVFETQRTDRLHFVSMGPDSHGVADDDERAGTHRKKTDSGSRTLRQIRVEKQAQERRRRLRETEEERNRRLEKKRDAERCRIRRETEEERLKRLQKKRDADKCKRSRETEEERVKRLVKKAEAERRRRSTVLGKRMIKLLNFDMD